MVTAAGPVVTVFSPTQAVFIGMMISSSLWGNISDKYGRKTVSLNLQLVCPTVYPHEETAAAHIWSVITNLCVMWRAGSEDERAVDHVLRPDERVCTHLRLDSRAPGTGGLWDWRSTAIVRITHLFVCLFALFIC